MTPKRVGKNRLYSDRDIERLRQIQRFTQEMGVNLAGVEVILGPLERLDQLQRQMEQTRKRCAARWSSASPRSRRPAPKTITADNGRR